jgi:hypothetical protein
MARQLIQQPHTADAEDRIVLMRRIGSDTKCLFAIPLKLQAQQHHSAPSKLALAAFTAPLVLHVHAAAACPFNIVQRRGVVCDTCLQVDAKVPPMVIQARPLSTRCHMQNFSPRMRN